MSFCQSFPPSVDQHARILCLGSMPGEESLRQQQYYAFQHNAFWRLTGKIFAFDPAAPYPQRLAALLAQGVALWDVLACCERSGSLDGNIRRPRPNDIPGLLQSFPGIEKICCNGSTAGKYLRRFFPSLANAAIILPSSSPAAARLSFEEKLRHWRQALAPAEGPPRTGP
ncbi:MAG: DNA-deoxyinosine glycosylase [Oligosphaeraceae bacterium]|nr:DNA-deoxyinosine glycosylase [Oligosphaeraceae bacterium]